MPPEKINYKYYINHLDRVHRYLDKPNVRKKGCCTSIVHRISDFVSQLFMRIARLWNFCFGDHHWYHEQKARKIVQLYLLPENICERTDQRSEKILQIYQRLNRLKKGQGTYADDFNKVDIDHLREEIKESKKPFHKPPLPISGTDLAKEYRFEHLPRRIFKQGPKISNQLLHHLEANAFGKNSQWEGEQLTNPLRYLYNYFHSRQLSEHPTLAFIMEKMRDAFTIATAPNFVQQAQKIITQCFSKEQSILIAGGWTGKPGHAIYYEIIPTEGSQARFRLYNLGAGTDETMAKIVGNKKKYPSYVEWKDLERQKFLNPDFLTALHELSTKTTIPEDGSATDYNAHDIYDAIRSYLRTYLMQLVEPPVISKILMSSQSAGVCAMKSLMAFVRTRLEEACGEEGRNCYKRLKCDLRLQGLVDKVNVSVGWDLPLWRLVQKSHEKICKSISRLYNDRVVGEAYLRSSKAYLERVDGWIGEQAQNVAVARPLKAIQYLPPSQDIDLRGLSAYPPLQKLLSRGNDKKVLSSSGSFLAEELKSLTRQNPAQIVLTLERIEKLGTEAWLSGDDHGLHVGLLYFIRNFPIDAEYLAKGWKEVCAQNQNSSSEKIAQKIIVSLGNIAGLFFKTCFTVPQAEVICPERLHLIRKIEHLQKSFADFFKPNQWPSIDPGDWWPDDIHFKSFDAKEHREIESFGADTYNKFAIHKKWDIHLRSYNEVGRSSCLTFSTERDQFSGFKQKEFIDLVKAFIPDIEAQLAKNDLNYNTYSRAYQKAVIYTSALLPHWLRSMRDTNCYLWHLGHEPVAKPTSLKRKEDLQLQFTLKSAGKESCDVYISVRGVTGSLVNEYPVVGKIRQNNNLRFTPTLGQFASANLNQLSDDLHNLVGQHEKELLADGDSAKKYGLSNEDFKELIHLFLGETVKPFEILEFFTKDASKLKNPDYQIFFRILMFDRNLHLHVEKHESELGQMLSRFLETFFTQFRGQNELQACVFLLRMSRYLASFFPKNISLDRTLAQLYALLDRPGLEEDERSIIYAELAAHLTNKNSDQLSDYNITDLLVSLAYLHEYPVPAKWRDPITQNDIAKAVHLHANVIENLLQNPEKAKAVVRKAMALLRPQDYVPNWVVETDNRGAVSLIRSEDSSIYYLPKQGRLLALKDESNPLPSSIRNHPHFCKLFANVRRARRYLGDKNEIYEFRDAKGFHTLVQEDRDTLLIEQLVEGTWMRFASSELFLKLENRRPVCSLTSRYLLKQHTEWLSLQNSKIFLRNDQGQICYEAAFQRNSVYEVRQKSDNAVLSTPSTLFSRFEDSAYIHEWYIQKKSKNKVSRNELDKVELPRFGLSFSHDAGLLKCDQFSGYYLNPTLVLSQMGSYSNYLILQNEEGQQKILLPAQMMAKAGSKPEVFLPLYGVYREIALEEGGPQRYYAYNVTSKGVEPPSKEAALYLAFVLTLVQKYEEAGFYLRRQGEKTTPYTQQEVSVLQQLIFLSGISGDESGSAAALYTYAGFLLLKNGTYQSKMICPIEAVSEKYDLYLKKYRNVSSLLTLTLQEEVFVLRVLLENQLNPLFLSRFRQIDPVQARQIPLPEEKEIKEFADMPSPLPPPSDVLEPLLPSLWNSPFTEEVPSKDKVLITRLEPSLRKHFLSFYAMATYKGSEKEKRWLWHAIEYLHASPDPKAKVIGYIFACFLKRANEFPRFPLLMSKRYDTLDTVNTDRISQWQKTVTDLINKHCVIHNPRPMPKPRQQIEDLTPQGFNLNASPIRSLNLVIPWKCPEIPPSPFDSSLAIFQTAVRPSITNSLDIMPILLSSGSDEANSKHTFDHLLAREPLYQREKERLLADEASFKAKLEAESKESTLLYRIDPNPEMAAQQIQAIEKALKKGVEASETRLAELKREIISCANTREGLSEAELVQYQLQEWSNKLKQITLDEAIVHFGRNLANLKRRNPALTNDDLQRLSHSIGEYLLLATQEQQRQRAKSLLIKVNEARKLEHHDEAADLVQQLAEEISAKREYAITEDKLSYLVFEYFADILMRKQQVNKLAELLQNNDYNLMMEMIMGSGKSKVLLPLLGMLRAEPNTLSMVIVPPSLFESIASDTQAILQGAFGQSLRALHFDRNTAFSVHSLQTILNDIVSIQDNCECLIMTHKSLEALMLKFIETSEQQNKAAELELMRKIINRIVNNGKLLLDEADSILDVLRALCFSIGAASSPNLDEVCVLSELYAILFTSPDVKALAKLKSDPQPNKDAPDLTERLYRKKVKIPLAEAFIDRLGQIQFASPALGQSVKRFVEVISKDSDQRKWLVCYLCHDKKYLDEAQNYFDQRVPADIKDLIALAAQEISVFFQHTLTRPSNAKNGYGLDTTKGATPIAIPFIAANTPSRGSQFANAQITMNYTFQIYIKDGITTEMIEREVERLQQEASRELREKSDDHSFTLENTKAWAVFQILKCGVDMPLFNYKPNQLAAVHKNINESIRSKIRFVERIILPQMQLFENQLSCNPLNFIGFFPRGKVTGFTGTLCNADSQHRFNEPQYEKGIATKTSRALFNNSRDAIVRLNDENPVAMLEQLEKMGYDVLIDAGGYFKEGGNQLIASKIAKLKGKGVVFYDLQGAQTIIDKKSASVMPLGQFSGREHERATFLDQNHTTGADVKQKPTAVGMVTIGEHMLRRDVEQSVWRLRKLDRAQKVVFAISDHVDSVIRQTLRITSNRSLRYDDIFRFTFMNQCHYQGTVNYKSYIEEMWDIPQQLLFLALLSDKLTPSERNQAYQHLKPTWIKPGIIKPSLAYGRLVRDRKSKDFPQGGDKGIARGVVSEEAERCRIFLEETFKKLPFLKALGKTYDDSCSTISSLSKEALEYLPETIPGRDFNQEQSMEVEQQMQLELARELEVHEETQKQKIVLGHVYHSSLQRVFYLTPDHLNEDWRKAKMETPYISLEGFLKDNGGALTPYASAFKGINVTVNVLEWIKGNHNLSGVKLLGNHRTPLHFAIVEKNEVTLLSLGDASEEFKRRYIKSQLYNLTMGFCKNPRELTPIEHTNVLKAKFLNGESGYSATEKEILRKWLHEFGPERMRKLFIEQIISRSPKKANAYHGSTLQKLFHEMIK